MTGPPCLSIPSIIMAVVFGAVTLAGCGDSQQPKPDQNATTAPASQTSTPAQANITTDKALATSSTTTDAHEMLKEAIHVMNNVKSFHFEVRDTISGVGDADVFPTVGDFEKPSVARGITDKGAAGQVMWIEYYGLLYERQPGTDTYEMSSTGRPPAAFLDFSQMTTLLRSVDDVTIEGEDTVDGQPTDHLKVIYELLGMPVLGTPAPKVQARCDIWVEKGSGYVRKIGISPFDLSQVSLAPTYYSKFNEPLSPPIEVPNTIVQTVQPLLTALPHRKTTPTP